MTESQEKGWLEKYGTQASLAALLGLAAFIGKSFDTRMSDQDKTMQGVVTNQAVTNNKLETLSVQLSNVPGLQQRVSTLEEKEARDANDIHDLQATRKLK